MRLFLSILFLFFLLPAKAATIAELFGDGVFGTQWGDTIEAVANKLPNTTKESVGDIAWLELKDSKEVLGVKSKIEIRHLCLILKCGLMALVYILTLKTIRCY